MDEVGEGPDHGHAGERNAEQDDVQEADAQDVGQPHSPAVHHSGVGIHLAVCCAYIHDGALSAGQHTHTQQSWFETKNRKITPTLHHLVSNKVKYQWFR